MLTQKFLRKGMCAPFSEGDEMKISCHLRVRMEELEIRATNYVTELVVVQIHGITGVYLSITL